jgi:hypothetical protein
MLLAGVLSIPFDTLTAFYEEYVRAVNAGERVFVVEQKTKTYNFFLDIDYCDHDELTVSDVKNLSQIICDKVRLLTKQQKALISVAEPKPKNDKIKSGVHINWPGLVVDQDGAVQLMHHVISTLNNVYLDRDWTTVIDASVYGTSGSKGSGFRLPWSHKKTRGTVEGMYLPIFEYSEGVLGDTEQQITVEKLMMATVRTECLDVQTIPECVVRRQ